MAFATLGMYAHTNGYRDRKSKQAMTPGPSGISLLRKSSDHMSAVPNNATVDNNHDAMNLDDFIFSDNISTPAGLGNSPTPELRRDNVDKPTNSVASAIPIKMRKESSQFVVPQSVPVPQHHPRHNEEFNYVQRHVRKTSIDERRVSNYFSGSIFAFCHACVAYCRT